MNGHRIEGYIESVYGYAVRRTYSQEEAEELSQEILLTAIRELPKLRDDSRFEPWLWGIASNVTKSFRRALGKQRAMFVYDMPQEMLWEESESDDEALCDFLRERIAMLSAAYREVIVLYYYDGLSVRQISERLSIPEGTVTWRLSEGRSKLKKECNEMNETALRPVKLILDIYGSGNYDGKKIPFPSSYINDALSQNLLYHCYDSAKSVEELAALTGVPAYYIEDRLANLSDRRAVISPVKGKYRTDFVIWTDAYGQYCEENAEKLLSPIVERMVTAVKALADDALAIDFYKASKPEGELTLLLGAMAFEYLSRVYGKLPYPEIEANYDGNCWRYIGNMESGRYQRIGMGVNCCDNNGSRGSYSHTVYTFGGFKWRKMMYDLYINACEDILTGMEPERNGTALAIRDGYIVRRADGSLLITVPAFTKAQKSALDALAERHFASLMPEYTAIVKQFSDGYRNCFPKHLASDAARMCQGVFLGMYKEIVAYGQRTGMLAYPATDSSCDVLVQYK